MNHTEYTSKTFTETVVVRTVAVFLLASLGLITTGFVPEAPKTMADAREAQELASASKAIVDVSNESPTPLRVVIEAIGVNVSVSSPKSTDVAVLDEALLKGAVRYPGSGTLTENKNMLIFGHSSHLPVVHNKAFQAFNDIEKLKTGDVIKVESSTHAYFYRVSTVRQADASEVLVRFNTGTKKLTLSTCDTFGKKSERFVVEADFVGKEVLSDKNI
jgi:LPXTG-site transpeptidase (sortase) family protein